MSKIDEGYVALDLIGRDDQTETLYLKPTLAAIRAVSRRYGDLQAAMQRMIVRDFDAVTFVIIQGLAIQNDKKASNRIEERIFRTGIADVAAVALRYVGVLQNGGRPLDEGGDEDDGGPEGNGDA